MAAETMRGPAASTIRAFRQTDAAAAAEILKASPEAAQWTEWGFRELLGWRGVLALVTEHEGRVRGFIMARQVAEEAEILNLAVILEQRRKGEGGALLKAAMDEFQAGHVSRVFLEVRESNEGGIAFYERRGFLKTGRRAGYYRNPEEAAIVMEMKLTG
jgi:[ribosomal protein S18]-alanine N-acetyltransferase